MNEPERAPQGRGRLPAEGNLVAAGIMAGGGVVLLVARLLLGEATALGVSSALLTIALGVALGWPAIRRMRRSRKREAQARRAPKDEG
ncbi:hypothetical protein [Leucobacter komagatae]|uniref:Uncharacterized protein n=1 Tax=Leucobacter komagatae TaxID=55969 RepID=A0A0D0HZN2_9MICO|nr:hypothetical protein [Leucobacter komagatae]KIP53011.1 hypothetical protein SD72_05840 [Leucobacter komagatae]